MRQLSAPNELACIGDSKHQVARLKAYPLPLEGEFGWLPIREYGINNKNEVYQIPITCKTLLSIMEGPPFKLIRIASPAQFSLDQKSLIYIGGSDTLQTATHESMFTYFEERVREVTKVYIPEGDHMLLGCEREVIEQIIKWARI